MDDKIIKPEIHLSLDVEANGPVPGLYSMLSFGYCAFTVEDGYLDAFDRNLKLLPGAGEDPDTMAWWASTPENQAAYFKTRVNMVDPKQAMHELDNWVASFEKTYKIVNIDGFTEVAGPRGFDYPWITYYLAHAKGHKRHHLGHACLDMRSYAAGMLKKPYRSVGKGSYPQEWFEPNLPHTHIAKDDAIEQGAIVYHMMRANLGLPFRYFMPDNRKTAYEALLVAGDR